MEKFYRPFEPCLYPSLCADCKGVPEGVDVHLASGEQLQFRDITGIELTAEEIVLHKPDGETRRFPRREVVYAGCARVSPAPFN